MADVKMTVDVTDAKKFLDEIATAARAQFAICRAGDVVFVECERALGVEEYERMRNVMKQALEETGVRVVVLSKGMRVARINLENPEGG